MDNFLNNKNEIKKYLKNIYFIDIEKFNELQTEEIIKGYLNKDKVNFLLYANPEFNAEQMREIRLGFEHAIPANYIYIYANPVYNSEQMKEIRLGLESDIAEHYVYYINPKLTAEQIREIKLGIKDNKIFSHLIRKVYGTPEYSAAKMQQLRFFLKTAQHFENIFHLDFRYLFSNPVFSVNLIKNGTEFFSKLSISQTFYSSNEALINSLKEKLEKNIEIIKKILNDTSLNMSEKEKIFENLISFLNRTSYDFFFSDCFFEEKQNRLFFKSSVFLEYLNILLEKYNNILKNENKAFDYFLNKESFEAYDYFINTFSLSEKNKEIFLKIFLTNRQNCINLINFLKNNKTIKIIDEWKDDIIKGLLNGLTDKQIRLFLNVNINSSIRTILRKQIEKNKDLTAEQIYIFMQYNFNEKIIDKKTLKNINIVNKNGEKVLICKDKKTKNKLPNNIKEKLNVTDIFIKDINIKQKNIKIKDINC